ncbi:hypothetical protein Bca4012_018903 [Brassica carinata]
MTETPHLPPKPTRLKRITEPTRKPETSHHYKPPTKQEQKMKSTKRRSRGQNQRPNTTTVPKRPNPSGLYQTNSVRTALCSSCLSPVVALGSLSRGFSLSVVVASSNLVACETSGSRFGWLEAAIFNCPFRTTASLVHDLPRAAGAMLLG